MKASLKKWTWMGVSLALIAAGSWFLLQLDSRRKDSPAAAPAQAADPDHELKALGVELGKKPGHAPVLMRMAQIERDQGKLSEAAGHLREAVRTEPGNLDARLELGRVLYEKGEAGEAIAETEKILASNPRHVDALYNLGAIYANLGDPRRARSYWTRAAEADAGAESGRKARDGLAKLSGS